MRLYYTGTTHVAVKSDPLAPRLLLRLEGLGALGIALLLYHAVGGAWALFGMLFFAPDLGILAYLGGRRLGAITYNALHTYLWPALMFAAGFTLGRSLPMALALIWTAHIGVDRVLGLGLKYSDQAFMDTHFRRL